MSNKMQNEAMLKEQDLTTAQQSESTSSVSETPALDILSEMLGKDVKENPNLAFMAVILGKEILPWKDALDATGLSERKFKQIFDSQYHPLVRRMRTDERANKALSKHLEREDLLPHQRFICELLWRRMCYQSMGDIMERIEILTGRWMEYDYPRDEAFCESTYDITVDDFEYAMEGLMVHIIDSCDQKAEN